MKKWECLCVLDAYFKNGFLYAENNEFNGFFRYDMKTMEAECIGTLDGFQHAFDWQIRSVYEEDNLIFLVSAHSYGVATYSIATGEFKYYYPDAEHNIAWQDDIVRATCRVGDKIWIFRDYRESCLCVFSMKDYTYEFISLDISKLKAYYNDYCVSLENSWVAGENVWKIIPGSNVIYSISTVDYEINIFPLPSDICLFAINLCEGNFYCITMDGKDIICWNERQGLTARWNTGYEKTVERAYRTVIPAKNGFILIPCLEDKIAYCEKQENGLCLSETYIEIPGVIRIPGKEKGMLFVGCSIEGQKLYLYPFSGKGMPVIDLNTLEISFYPFKIKAKEYLKYHLYSQKIIPESEMCLSQFVSSITE